MEEEKFEKWLNFELSELHLQKVEIELDKENMAPDYYYVKIFGGLNGHGNWNYYINQISAIVHRFNLTILDLNYDSLDDVFYINAIIDK